MRECYNDKCKFHKKKEPFCILSECIDTLMNKIRDDDPEILIELAEIILSYRESKIKIKEPKLNTIQVTGKDIKTMNKAIREKVKR